MKNHEIYLTEIYKIQITKSSNFILYIHADINAIKIGEDTNSILRDLQPATRNDMSSCLK